MIGRHPAVQCAGVADVTSAVGFTRSHNVGVALRVTGQDVGVISL